MPISDYGELNATALIVPDVYVQIVPPQQLLVQGVPTNVIGMVGVGSWGPVNKAVTVGNMSDVARAFGPVTDRPHDLATDAAIATQQGANSFRMVRVSDGTDDKASVAGSRLGTFAAVVRLPGLSPERFDNIGGTGATFWQNVARAINEGDGFRAASQLVRATAGTAATAPTLNATYSLSGGSDGADDIDVSVLIGQDGLTRTGIYALRGSDASILHVCGLHDTTAWPAVAAFAKSESLLAVLAGPGGMSIENAATIRASVGLDDWRVWLLFGDHPYWLDSVNGRLRRVSPAAFAVGRTANLSPHISPLNKPIFGVVSSERVAATDSGSAYSRGELEALGGQSWDVLTTPSPRGEGWGVRFGRNASSDPSRRGVAYTRMTHFLARTIDRAFGAFVGEPVNRGLMPRVRASMNSLLAELERNGMLGNYEGAGPAFRVVCDMSNNTVETLGRGILRVDVQVRYAATVETLIVNLEGGQGVTITLAGDQ